MFTQFNTHRLTVIIFFVFFIAVSITTAATRFCSVSSPVESNLPAWVATRQQYETTYVPPQLNNTPSQTVDANSGIWLATRQQYETTYVPPQLNNTPSQTVDANSGIWLATRQQYETTYVPPQITSIDNKQQLECLV